MCKQLSKNHETSRMRFYAIFFLFLFLVILLAANSFGRSPFSEENTTVNKTELISELPCVDLATHDINKIGFTLTNTGRLGTGFENVPGDIPSCIFPYPGENEYLFAGAIWIGAVVNGDTLVSVGSDGWRFTQELWPDTCDGGAITSNADISDQDYIAVYMDTLTDSILVPVDPYNNRPHIPLNIEITQKSHAWNNELAEDIIIIEYSIHNLGDQTLDNAFIGVYIDSDVMRKGAQTGFDDDITGYLEFYESQYGQCMFEDTLNIAWIADNDGIQQGESCPFDSISLTAITGISLIRTPSDSLQISYNWWMPNGNPALDWGPRLAGTEEDPFRDFGGFMGSPEGDENKYYILSHKETDYDQLFTAIDQTSEGWLAPPAFAENLADGYDARYLISFGPFKIEAGETLPFVLSYVGGENFHSDCDAFENIYDPSSPQIFHDQLNFDDIVANALFADWIYDNPGVDTDGDGYKGKYRICVIDSILTDTVVQQDPLITDTFWLYAEADTIYYKGDGVPDFKIPYVCGDCNRDGAISILDITYLISYIYQDGPAPIPYESVGDVNYSGDINLLDITCLIRYVFKNGPEPRCWY